MDFKNQRDNTIILQEKGKVHHMAIEDIVYVECEGYISTIHTCNKGNPLTCSILLKYIEEKLNKYGFCRISRNTLVNLKYFESYVSGKKRCFKTTTGIEMNVSRRRWYYLKRVIEQ